MALTRKQRQLLSEIERIASGIGVDHWNIEQAEKPNERMSFLLRAKDQLVRGEVVTKYTLLDEILTDIICNYYFRQPKTLRADHSKLWKTKRFRIFAQYLMDELYILKKLAIVHAIKAVPKNVAGAVARINDVRNALAHSFFPENRRRYAADNKVMYGDVHIFTPEGVEKFEDDFHVARRYLMKRAFGVTMLK